MFMSYARSLALGAALALLPSWSVQAQAVAAASDKPVDPKLAQDTLAKGLPVDGVAAIVGDQVILVSEVLAEVNRRRAAGAKVTSQAEQIALEQGVIDQLVEAELLVQKAKAEKKAAAKAERESQTRYEDALRAGYSEEEAHQLGWPVE